MDADIQENLERLRERMARAAHRARRSAGEVRLVAVTKTVPQERIAAAVDAGVEILGENYVQEAEKKRAWCGRPVQWHMIGHLQSNKARAAVVLFDAFETVDREKIVLALQRQAREVGKTVEVFIQVNLAAEASKTGASPDQVLPLVRLAAGCDHLRCRGLMTMPPFFDQPEKARPFFAGLRELRDRLRPVCPPNAVLEELSMGMSGDFEVAIEEGATLVRIGTALFGAR